MFSFLIRSDRARSRDRATTCSPVAMSFNRVCPAAISSSPRISANRAPILLATSRARFSFRSTLRSTTIPGSAQLGRDFAGVQIRRLAHAAQETRRPRACDSSGCASSTLITRRSSPIENPIPGAGTREPSDSARPS